MSFEVRNQEKKMNMQRGKVRNLEEKEEEFEFS